MAPGWEMGMEFGMGMGMEYEASVSAAAAPTTLNSTAAPAYMYGLPSTDSLRIDDLLDFSNHDLLPSSAAPNADTHLLPPPPEPSAAATSWSFTTGGAGTSDYHNPHLSTAFPDDLYIPCEEAAELEWLSQFVEDSFSDVPYPPYATGHILNPSADALTDPSSVPGGGARSKRSKASASTTAHHQHHLMTAWSSLAPPPPTQSSSSSTTSSSSSSDVPGAKPKASINSNSSSSSGGGGRKKGGGDVGSSGIGLEGGMRRCTHCASEKTPQWRTGPLGPKTLCNACGVRYKSGRLVPEYRPAASPTFALAQHSNSHRKVMELRRQKELILIRHDNHTSSSVSAAAARPDLLFHDYEVC